MTIPPVDPEPPGPNPDPAPPAPNPDPVPMPGPGPGLAAPASAGPLSANFSTSSLVIRPLRPVPVTFDRSMLSSRAIRRTDGLA